MKAGAAAIAPRSEAMRTIITDLFRTNGDMSDTELVAAYNAAVGEGIYRSIGTRRRELVDAGVLRDTGVRRKNPATGVSNIIWGMVI
jgi:hypothetical protein